MLNQFAQGREQASIATIRTADIEEWLAERATTPGYRHTWINRLSTLFSFAKRQEWIVQNPCDRVERVVIERKRPQILTVDQAKTCATAIRDEFPVALGWLALALFCGLRPEEAEKLQWSDIDLQKGIVTVDAAASKVRWRRLVYCTPCAVRWLTKAKALNASLPIPLQTRRRALSLMSAKLGFDSWPKDILRHTCASMLMAVWEDRLPRRSPNSLRPKPEGQGRRLPRQFAYHSPRPLPRARYPSRGEEVLGDWAMTEPSVAVPCHSARLRWSTVVSSGA